MSGQHPLRFSAFGAGAHQCVTPTTARAAHGTNTSRIRLRRITAGTYRGFGPGSRPERSRSQALERLLCTACASGASRSDLHLPEVTGPAAEREVRVRIVGAVVRSRVQVKDGVERIPR